MPEISFIDTTLRDGSQSLWASRLSTSIMLAVIEDLDAAGFESMEFGRVGADLRAVNELDEDPSAWLRLGPPLVKTTPLRWIGAASGRPSGPGMGARSSETAVGEMRLRHAIDKGITITRISDPWNNFERLSQTVRYTSDLGMRTIVNLIYSISPRHTDEYYVRKAAEAAAIKPYRICFKDVGGILTPERARVLMPQILAASGDIPVEFHAHCCTGMAAACLVVAAESGIYSLHTGVPPLAEGSAQPSIFTAVQNMRELGFDTAIDLVPLQRASAKLWEIARRLGYPTGAPVDLDYRNYRHQIPGGMISHLVFQLGQVGQTERLPEVLAETARVREELGFPIMVTPLSQFVGSQAGINVITGQRYASVTDEVIRYALGLYGDEAPELMDPDIRHQILNRKRTEELLQARKAPEPSVDELRAQFGNVTDEELTYLVTCGERALPLMRRKKEVTAFSLETSPEARWLRGLPAPTSAGEVIEVRRDGVAMRVGFRGDPVVI